MKFSVVLTICNDSNGLPDFLDSIFSQTLRPSELIISDAASDDQSIHIVNAHRLASEIEIKTIENQRRLNIAEGFNQAIKETCFNDVICVCVGNEYPADFFERLIHGHALTNAHVTYGGVMGKRRTFFARTFCDFFLKGRRPADWGPSNRGVCIRRTVFSDFGLFWEHFYYAGEDTEFFSRIRKYNAVIRYEPTAQLIWREPECLKEFFVKMRVNAVADWQIKSGIYVWVWGIFLPLIMLFGFVFLAIYKPIFAITGCVLLLALFAVKKRTFNILAIGLGVLTRYVMVFYYLNQRAFSGALPHINELESPKLNPTGAGVNL